MGESQSHTIIDLLRHGEAEGGDRFRGSTDDALSTQGWTQMWAAVGADCPWDGIVSSPLIRCADFARALAQRHGLPVTVDEQLREMHFGAWEGCRSAELLTTDAAALTHFWNDPINHTPPDGESFAHVQQRVCAAWDNILSRSTGRHVLIIAHGGPIRIILGHVLNMPPDALLRLELPCAALSRVRVDQHVASLVFHAGRL